MQVSFDNVNKFLYNGNTVARFDINNQTVWTMPDINYLTFESLEAGNVFKLYSTNETLSAKTIQYSTNKLDWTNVTASDAGTTIITLNAGQKVYLRGDNPHGMNYWKSGVGHNPCYFSASKKFNISGCIMSLSFMDNTASYNDTGDGGSMYELFKGSPVVDASGLILNQVFATASGCSGMFTDCTQLTGAPALPATSLSNYCYSTMFKGCTSLVTAPDLPAATLKQYSYNQMFAGCTKLSTIKLYATDVSANNCLRNWVNSVKSSGIFYKKSSLTLSTGTSGIPSGWTVRNTL